MKGKKFLRLLVFCVPFILAGPVLAGSDYEAGFNNTQEDTKSLGTDEPISAANGAYYFDMRLLSPRGPMDLTFRLFYRSDALRIPFFSFLPEAFWWSPFGRAESELDVGDDKTATIYLPDRTQISFKKDESENWILSGPTLDTVGFVYVDNFPQTKYRLKETSDYLYLMDPVAHRLYIFKKYIVFPNGLKRWRIAWIMDRNGNTLTYTYSGALNNNPALVEDGLGRSLSFTYGFVGVENLLQTVGDQAGRQVTLNYEANGADNDNDATLRSVRDPMGNTTTFQYGGRVLLNHLITRQMFPLGNTPYTQTYALQGLYGNSFPRVVSQQDQLGHTTNLSYDSTTNRVTIQNPDGTSRQFEHYSSRGFPKSITDATGKTAHFAKSSDEHLTGVTDRMGDSASFTYDESGKFSSVTNAKGQMLSSTYSSQDQTFTNPADPEQVSFTFRNLTRIDYPDGTNEQFSYDAKGNVLTRTDRAGKTWTYTYDSKGQVLTVTNPTGGVITHNYNGDGTLASTADSDGVTRTFAYDAYKRLQGITRGDGTSIAISHDLNDRVTSITDENNHTYTYAYDANGNLTGITDPKGNQIEYSYDLMDRVTEITDRLDKDTGFTYDSMGRIQSITDPNNLSTNYQYNTRGWLDRVTLGGQTRQRGYDDEGVASSGTTPLGHSTAYQTDKLGFTTAITNPLNQTTTLTRDSMSRITGITDPLSRTKAFSYDGWGLLSGVTMPALGTSSYQRNNLGRLGQLTDLNGQNWLFGYTNIGRPSSMTDPLFNVTNYGYDNRGRVNLVNYPDGTAQTIGYDGKGNITERQYTGGLNLQYTYDELNRLLTGEDISFTRDAEGRITATDNPGTVFGATYDDGGRLKTVSYNNNLFTVTYGYDGTTGLLSSVTDNMTSVLINFTYDNDRKMTEIGRSNGVDTTYVYDNAGRLTRIQDGSFMDFQYTLDAAGQVTNVNMTAPLDPAGFLTPGTNTFTYDAASQVSRLGYTYDGRGRLTASPNTTFTWEGPSRLVGINSTVLAYNGLNDLITRAEGGTTIHYYYNYAISLNPIVAEKNDTTGQFLRYYVWTPAGRLLYVIDAADGNKVYFYHFDKTGNTMALTNQNGAVSDSYAYDPYGELLEHQGSSQQPFTFVGQWGLRQESNDHYHMRARYYDALTARFVSRDPIWPQLDDPRQINPYQYALNDPIGLVDRTGRGAAGERVVDERQMTLNDLLKNRYNAAGDTVSSDESDRIEREAVMDFFEQHPVNESQMSLEELMKHRMFIAGVGEGLSEKEMSEIDRKAVGDFFEWHPVDESQMSLEELMKHHFSIAGAGGEALSEKEMDEAERKAFEDYLKHHPEQRGNMSWEEYTRLREGGNAVTGNRKTTDKPPFNGVPFLPFF